ncbi:flagellar protein FliT [Nitrosospira lacus]|uniref:Flagellar protein FliT n=2 Tax=Nitrosospira lacus TaxID=1288494 RepID=A0A1W6SQH8_9PROT|nr:flagellar protein FliT [Nitrosospira lacus]
MSAMSSMDTLTAYQNISNVTGEMAAAARAGQWDRLTVLERHYSALVSRLAAAKPARLTNDMLRQKIELIHKILADDAEIRSYTEPWLDRVQSLLGNAGMERRLRRAYDQEPGGA